jgi:hypothetical protein
MLHYFFVSLHPIKESYNEMKKKKLHVDFM